MTSSSKVKLVRLTLTSLKPVAMVIQKYRMGSVNAKTKPEYTLHIFYKALLTGDKNVVGCGTSFLFFFFNQAQELNVLRNMRRHIYEHSIAYVGCDKMGESPVKNWKTGSRKSPKIEHRSQCVRYISLVHISNKWLGIYLLIGLW